jgi:hypothetical protein
MEEPGQRCRAARYPKASRQRDFPNKRLAMVNDDAVKCPLCGGFTHVEKPDLLAALKPPQVREQVESHLAQLWKTRLEELSAAAVQAGRDFQKRVHSWNLSVPMWKRCPKE